MNPGMVMDNGAKKAKQLFFESLNQNLVYTKKRQKLVLVYMKKNFVPF